MYRDIQTGVVLARSSQPTVGWLGWRNTHDEALLKAVAESCSLNTGLSSDEINGSDTSAIITMTSVLNVVALFFSIHCKQCSNSRQLNDKKKNIHFSALF
jgi:Myotubularin-like phosphatase domain